MSLLRANILLSTFVALVGLLVPIGLSLIGFVFIYEMSPLQGFTAGAAMCSTSLGTTMAILSSFGSDVDLRSTRIGTVLLSAAMIDDVVGLIMASVVGQVSGSDLSGGSGLAWTILRPVVASFGVTMVTPLFCRYVFAPVYGWCFRRFSSLDIKWSRSIVLFVLLVVLSAFLAISNYAGTSMLFGAYVGGCTLGFLDDSTASLRETEDDHKLLFDWVFTKYIAPSNDRIFVPLFFATIGAAIPFVPLFRPSVLWKGVLYSGLMFFGKFVTGLCVMIWGRLDKEGKDCDSDGGGTAVERVPEKAVDAEKNNTPTEETAQNVASSLHQWPIHPALLIALAMVARGEIALIIAQIGRETLGEEGFLVVIWAVVLCTLLGPLLTGILVRKHADKLGRGIWGEVTSVGR